MKRKKTKQEIIDEFFGPWQGVFKKYRYIRWLGKSRSPVRLTINGDLETQVLSPCGQVGLWVPTTWKALNKYLKEYLKKGKVKKENIPENYNWDFDESIDG